MADDRSVCQKVKDLYEDNIVFWQSKHDAAKELYRFRRGDRYDDDSGEFNRDRRLIEIRGQEITDTIRHGVAKATENRRTITARLREILEDPQMAQSATEAMVGLVEAEQQDPDKCFEDELEAVVFSSKSERLGMLWMDWHKPGTPGAGKNGLITYSWEHCSRFMWDPHYMDPHHPLCGWLIRDYVMDVEQARKAFKAPWLQPDNAEKPQASTSRADQPLNRNDRDTPRATGRNQITLRGCWYKNDPTYTKRETGGDIPYEPGDRYMSCVNGCGYRSQKQQDLQESGKLEGELPEEVEPSYDEMGNFSGGCPDCAEQGIAGSLERIDARAEEESLHVYSRGKRLVIIAPFSPGPDEKPVYDGKWPISSARSFPVLVLTAYLEPGDPGGGQCDVDMMWDQQAAKDQLQTAAVQSVLEHRNFYLMDGVGLVDWKGERWEARDDQFNLIFRDRSLVSQWGVPTLEILNGTGVDPNYGLVLSTIDQSLTSYRGISDVGLTSEVDKSQSGVAIAQRNQIGEIPSAHFNRRKNRSIAKFTGVQSDYIRATYTPAMLVRLSIEGVDVLTRVWGEDLPQFDFAVDDAPEFSGLEESRAKAVEVLDGALQRAIGMGVDPVIYVGVVGKVLKLPQSTINEYQEMLAARVPMGPDGQPMPPSGPVPPEAEPMAEEMDPEMNGGGMVPLPAV